MNSRFINLFRFFFVCVDLLALNAVHFILVVTMDRIPGPAEYRYMLLFLVANMLWLLSAYGTGLYNANGTPHFEFYAKRTVKSLILFFISMLSFIFVYHYQFSRLFITLSFIGFATVLVLTRALIFGASFYMNKLSKITKKIVIVGYNGWPENWLIASHLRTVICLSKGISKTMIWSTSFHCCPS